VNDDAKVLLQFRAFRTVQMFVFSRS